MSRHGFRFVHATNLRLDEPLIGTGPLSGPDRELAEQATILAWEGVVETCLTSQAEFLLLTGNCFDHRTQSLRARVSLERGFEKLDAHHIDVFVVPGHLDPASAWKRWVQLPPNVTLIGDEQQEPVAVVRNGSVLASLLTIATPETDETNWTDGGPVVLEHQAGTYHIGILPAGTPVRWKKDGQPEALNQPGVSSSAASLAQTAIDRGIDLIACGEGLPFTHRKRNSLIHDPGPAQSLSKNVTGSCGCSVIDVDADGETRIDDVAIAPIRWEDITLSIERHTNWNDLVERMALMVMERVADNDEQLWVMNWRVKGEGKLFDSLRERESETEMWDLLEGELDGETEVRRIHRLERMTKQLLEPESLEEATGLQIDFEEILKEEGSNLVELVRHELLESDWIKRADAELVRMAIAQASRRKIERQAEATAGHWLH
ncbi:metallophosphoesterase family protein [Thalassoglobus sp.]|uniref:metallophosphoesterase family protein n=1 Tax=Thalassoglobus sp. TaxID=2795869 RepID=UPI003AA9B660